MRLRTRHPQWELRLAAVLDAWQAREYAPAWGQDCAAFALAAIEAVHGDVPPLDGARYTTATGQARFLKANGWADLVAAADALLGHRIPVLAAHRGDIVSDGHALGVRTATGYAAFSHDGLVMMHPSSLVAAWPVGRAD